MAPLAASFDSLRRIECSTRAAGDRLKCVLPSLSNSATSLTCIVVAMKVSSEKRTRPGHQAKHIILPQKGWACPRGCHRRSIWGSKVRLCRRILGSWEDWWQRDPSLRLKGGSARDDGYTS